MSFNKQDKYQNSDLIERMVNVNRVTKVVKGGRIMSFSVITVVGDGNGRFGIGKGRAREVSSAVQKSLESARKNMCKYELKEGTFYHEMTGKHGATKVQISPAKQGKGVIAGGALRHVFEVMGVKNVVAKSHGSTNPANVIRAAINALEKQCTPYEVALKRGKTIEDILS